METHRDTYTQQQTQRLLRYLLSALALAAVLAGLLPARSAQAAASSSEFQYVAETGHNLIGPIASFYNQHGGQTIFGNPITELISVGGVQVQYFERARFELGADGSITLAQLGRAAAEGRSDSAFDWLAGTTADDRTFFAQSGHTLGGAFGWFWQNSGGLAIFGYPISEEFYENGVLVQYFERVRLEYHPETPDAEVQISSLGHDYAQRQGVTAEQLAPTDALATLASANIRIASAAIHNVTLAAQRINGTIVAPGEEISFLDTVGEISTKAGYEEGESIVQGVLTTSVGGGICYVSTALYRAAFLAGMPISERHPHSLALAAFSDIPGFDAAVDTSGLDLRWKNTTDQPILITATLSKGTLTVALQGHGDGRTTTMRGPSVQKDTSTLTATLTRVVQSSGGTRIASEKVTSRYTIPAETEEDK